MIDVLAIDRWSVSGTSWLHRASTPAKLASVALIVTLLVVSRHAAGLGVVLAGLLLALATSGLPLRPLIALAFVPVLMSSLFALTRVGGTWESAAVIVEKGVITSFTMLLLVCTTPRTDLFRALRRVMPTVLADMILLAYRSIFILLERALDTRQALRLRGPHTSMLEDLRRAALVAGLTILRANELASEQYAAMRLRGYPGIAATTLAWRRQDVRLLGPLLAIALAALAALPGAPLSRT